MPAQVAASPLPTARGVPASRIINDIGSSPASGSYYIERLGRAYPQAPKMRQNLKKKHLHQRAAVAVKAR